MRKKKKKGGHNNAGLASAFRLMSHRPVKHAQGFVVLAKIVCKDFNPAGVNILAVTQIFTADQNIRVRTHNCLFVV